MKLRIGILTSFFVLLMFTYQLLFAAEGRMPLSEPAVISQSGSYIVTSDIEATGDAIVVSVGNVTIDLDGHTVRSTGGYGILCSGYSNIKIMNGKLEANSGGVFLNTPGGNFTVENLIVTVTSPSSGSGISVYGSSTTPARAVVRGNVVRRTTTGYLYGIYFSYARGNVEGNKITGYARGISFSNAANSYVDNNYSGENTHGIYLSASTHVTLRNNMLSQNSSSGIYLISNADYNTLTDNSASGNSNYGIYLSSTSSENSIEGCTTACGEGTGLYVAGCANIYSNIKAPGACGAYVNASCTDPNIDGGGNNF